MIGTVYPQYLAKIHSDLSRPVNSESSVYRCRKIVFFPVWQNFLADLEFMLLNTFKTHFSLRSSLFIFPRFLSSPDFTQTNLAAQFQTLTAPDSAGSQSERCVDM